MTQPSMAMLLACLIITLHLPAQDNNSLDKALSFPNRFLDQVGKKCSRLEDQIINKSERALKQLVKQERRLQKKLLKKDSILTEQVFGDARTKYQSFTSQLKQKATKLSKHKEYIPLIDSLNSSIRFLEKNNVLKDNPLAKQALGNIEDMENRFQQVAQIQQYLRNRRAYLKEQLSRLGMLKELKRYNQQIGLYNAQIDEYKSLLKEPDKIERKVLDLLSRTKAFQDFMSKNSMLASLFRLPDNSSNAANLPAIPGLQTRTQVGAVLQQTAGISGPNASQIIQSNVQEAQTQLLEQIKNKINQLGGSAPDNGDQLNRKSDFPRNTQRVKQFWKRIEYTTNLQSTHSNAWLPSTTDLGLLAGFKISDKSVIGIGMAGKIGWGKDFKHIIFSYEGISARSYFDYRIHKSFWLSGAYELNYRASFNRIEELKNLNAYQPSGLLGITKKYQIGKKMKGRMSLLWDFLSYRQQPQQQAIIWRLGYGIK